MTIRWNLEGREWLGAAACLSMLLVLACYQFVELPLQSARQDAQAESAKVRAEVVAVENYQNAHLDFSAFEKDLLEQQVRADQALPDQLEQGRFLTEVQQQAIRHQVLLQSVTPGKVQSQDGVKVLPVQLRFHCSYFALLAFLREIQNSDRYISVQQTAIQVKEGLLDCEMLLHIFAMET